MNTGIYVITNTANGKQYVGSAVNFERRFRDHRRRFTNNSHPNPILSNAWKKYGEDCFKFSVLLICDSDHLLLYEQRAIDTIHPEYNICLTAGSMLGFKRAPFSKQHRDRLSAARKLRNPEKRTEEQRLRMSLAFKKSWSSGLRKPRKPFSDETKKKISNALKGNTNGKATKGIPKPPVTKETRLKLSASTTRVWNERKSRDVQ